MFVELLPKSTQNLAHFSIYVCESFISESQNKIVNCVTFICEPAKDHMITFGKWKPHDYVRQMSSLYSLTQ